MELCKTNLKDVVIIKPDIHTDFRGESFMVWHTQKYKELGIAEFVEHNIFTASKDVLIGIHYSPNCQKLYQCLYGKAYYAFVNCDETDPEFGKWQSFTLSDKNHQQLIKPPQYGTGLLAISDHVIIHVMQSEYYNPEKPKQKTFMWNDPRFGIFWPTENPILSQRDKGGHYIDKGGLDV